MKTQLLILHAQTYQAKLPGGHDPEVLPVDSSVAMGQEMHAHLTRGNLGWRARCNVLGLWKMTDFLFFRSFLKVPFLTAFAAARAFDFVSFTFSLPEKH
jgi:hypothetical protein